MYQIAEMSGRETLIHNAEEKLPHENRAIFEEDFFFSSFASGISALPPTTSEVKNEYHEGDDEQNMDESTGDMERKSTGPKKQKQNGDN